ncbi:MAG TPA: helix-turn-helix domain-containing protein [Candidatus Krumholzibacteria bacterium]|nr:helix-turn-helix domain-containing protein [Candidatus Krumholzibacteria bacterium]
MRKRVFSKEDVIEAALAVARQEGLSQVTARRVADQLGASTAPVYSNFPTMEALTDAVKQAAARELLALTRRSHTEDAFLNIGIGVLTFVWQTPKLYADLFLSPHEGYDSASDILDELLGATASLPELEPLDQAERTVVLKKMAVFTHGLAIEICHGCAEACTLDVLVLLLSEVGRAVVADARQRHPRTAAEAALLDHLWGDAPHATHHAKDEMP